jgi:hypothetical protein
MKYLNEKQLSEINLPKWPGCDVDGSPVTREQAMEILARTFGGYFSTNDREFEEQVKEIYYTAGSFEGIPERGEWWDDDSRAKDGESEEERRDRLHKSWNFQSAYQGKMGLLPLEYLSNQRVCSSYIGGPYGWCDWSGRIHQRDKNIGKWPSANEVYNEWATIAKAFPYLTLECRLLTHEAGYHRDKGLERPEIAVVYEVSNGVVKARMPVEADYAKGNLTESDGDISFDFMLPGAERGVSLSVWREACCIVAGRNSRHFEGSRSGVPIELISIGHLPPLV